MAVALAVVALLGCGPVAAGATTFGPSALDAGNPDDRLACSSLVPGAPARLQRTTWAVASYVLPCGAWVELCAGSRCVVAQVLDRGPVRARPCAVQGDDPKCLIAGLMTEDIDVSYPVGVALGIADERGRATRSCVALSQANGRTRGCAVTWRIVSRPPAVAWGWM